MPKNIDLTDMEFYKINETDLEQYFQVSYELFNNPYYKKLNLGAKLLYSVLKDRMKLSQKNGWADKDGNVYIIYTRDNIEEFLGVSHATAVGLFNELVKYNLIYEKRQGQGKPNLIYVAKIKLRKIEEIALPTDENEQCDPETLGNTEKYKNYTSESLKSTSQEVQKINPNQSNISQPDFSQSVSNTDKTDEKQNEELFEMDQYELLLARVDNLEYISDNYKEPFEGALQKLFFEGVVVNGNKYPRSIVRKTLQRLNTLILKDVEAKLNQKRPNGEKVTKSINYIAAAIYNNIFEYKADTELDPFISHINNNKKE